MTVQDLSDKLVELWKAHCQDGDFVFLSKKDPLSGRWTDRAFLVNKSLQKEVHTWLDKNPPEKYHLYFCPLPFTTPRRQKQYVRGSRYLWSDLDEVDINKLAITPSIYWESSPGRYQGLWELEDFLPPKEAEQLSKQLAYKLGADKSGWDLTQVLRIPGTKNHKYENSPDVGEAIHTGKSYSTEDLPEQEEKLDLDDRINLDARKILAKYRVKIPRKALTLLLSKRAEVGKRSDIIWYLEQTLSDVGLSPPEIITLIKHSVWNKYAGRADEDERLKVELQKIVEGKLGEEEATPLEVDNQLGLRVDSYSDLMSSIPADPGWLVDGFWTRQSHGIVAGEPKAFKSILSLDMAISVASGEPFLGYFTVMETGPVLIIQNENSEWIMKDRVAKIITHKGLVGEMRVEGRRLVGKFAPVLPVSFINQQGFQFNDPIHVAAVEKLVGELKPVLVIFDPLYLMFDGDMNSAKDLNPALNWLLGLKQRYHTGIMLVHHWNKGGTSTRGGQRMLGSTTLHGWVESAWYVKIKGGSKEDEEEESDDLFVDKPSGEPVSIVMEREFRGAGTYPKVEATIKLGKPGDPLYDIDMKKHVGRGNKAATQDVTNGIINILERSSQLVTQRGLAEELGVGRKAITKILEELQESGRVMVEKKGVKLI